MIRFLQVMGRSESVVCIVIVWVLICFAVPSATYLEQNSATLKFDVIQWVFLLPDNTRKFSTLPAIKKHLQNLC